MIQKQLDTVKRYGSGAGTRVPGLHHPARGDA